MKKLSDVRAIVDLAQKGYSDSKIAQELKMSRNTVRKYKKIYMEAQAKLNSDDPDKNVEELVEILNSDPKYDVHNRKPYKYNKEIDTFLEDIIKQEYENYRKHIYSKPLQKTKIHKMILDKGYQIGYTTISKKIDLKRKELMDKYFSSVDSKEQPDQN